MPRGSNPKSQKALADNRKPTQFSGDRAVKAAQKSVETRRNYASWRECFKQRMTPEQMDQMYDKLWNLFYKSNNLNALEVLLKGVDDGETTANNITIKFASEDMEQYGD